ncbi:hypothetical protein [Prescottella equi]|uniref:hypothetical protein n=1 Tax=Rhodococcus hoagii TaxID=43767 RepID=UPI0012F7B706|nr:hypothetical protein [Prescottella equi]MBM4590291.1 hypothetical protein [Prescottella equi]MBM4632100.1 hypothetical protein [Prescottella equi]MBM4696256.1 hypothetical protein [Prescottella equi]MBM4721837.1 hypothetical protein [Prescottella equi]UNQ33529.1 hypothetical protein MPC39_15595 [Prescottella equi]
MIDGSRHAVMLEIVAHEDTDETELDRQAAEAWDREFAASACTGRVRVPRPTLSEAQPP